MDTKLRTLRVGWVGNPQIIGSNMTQLKDTDRPEISILHTPQGIVVRAQGQLPVALIALVALVALLVLVGR